MATPYQIGIAVRDITPYESWIRAGSIFLWGFASRTQPCNGIYQPISARVLVVKDVNRNCVVLASVDLCAIDPAMTMAIRQRVSQAHNILPDSVLINVSHTHGAPTTLQMPTWQTGFDCPNPLYSQFVEDQVVGTIDDAFNNLCPGRIHFGRGQTDIGFDRHFGKSASPDPILDVIRVSGGDGNTLGVAFFTACHPVCLGNFNQVYADFPGFARERIEAETGGTALFFQGYGGTCNPKALDAATTGEALAGDVLSILNQPLQEIEGSLSATCAWLNLPFQSFPTHEVLQRARSAGGMFARWADAMEASDHSRQGSLPVELQGIRIGLPPTDCYLAASAHEVSSDLAEPVRNLRPAKRITTVGYCNSQHSYLPSDDVLKQPVSCNTFPFCEDNYEGGVSFAWYGKHAPLKTGVDEVFYLAHDELFNLMM